MWVYIFFGSLVCLRMEYIPVFSFRAIKSYLKLRSVQVWDTDAVFVGLQSTSWSMNTLQTSSLLEASYLGACQRSHIHRTVPFIYRNCTQFYQIDRLNSGTCICYWHSDLCLNLTSVGSLLPKLAGLFDQAQKQPLWISLVSFSVLRRRLNKKKAASRKETKVFAGAWQHVCFSL